MISASAGPRAAPTLGGRQRRAEDGGRIQFNGTRSSADPPYAGGRAIHNRPGQA
jgi:hypothetical protein